MPRYIFTKEERQRGGKTRKAQPDYYEACAKGWETTMQRHPFFARHYLKAKIKGDYPNGRVRKFEGE
jgi:hypothetical protein